MGLQRVRHNLATQQQQQYVYSLFLNNMFLFSYGDVLDISTVLVSGVQQSDSTCVYIL